MIYDITIPMDAQLAVWPGDTPYQFDLTWKMAEGETVNVGTMTMSAHTGTHVDAPFHFHRDGASIETIPLSVFVGPAVVINAEGKEILGRELFEGIDFTQTPRVLIQTCAWTDFSCFPKTVPTLAKGVAEYLGRNGVVLLGIDVPSVDCIDSKELPNHYALSAQGITILESANLNDVPPGVYHLVAVPLRIVGGDASPVRAILIP